MSADGEKLTLRQEAFCRAVLSGQSHTDSAKAAGYSARTARSAASRLLTLSHVQAELARLRAAADVDAVLTLDAARKLLSRVALDSGERTSQRLAAVELLSKLSGWQRLAIIERPGEPPQRVEIVWTDPCAAEPDAMSGAATAALPAPDPAAQAALPPAAPEPAPTAPAPARPRAQPEPEPAPEPASLARIADSIVSAPAPRWDLW